MSSESDAGSKAGVLPREVGRTFGRFRLLDKVGTGDIAEVYRAIAVGVEGFERRIAIKVMQPEVQEEQLGRLFAEEARVSAMLQHPNIVQVYEFGVIEDAPFIAMEYLRGKNLEQTLATLRGYGEGLAPSLAVSIAQQVASALVLAHELFDEQRMSEGLVHGEVIPANIMLVREGGVKLLDFGAAALAHDHRYTVTRRGRPMPRHVDYLAPEQVAGLPPDPRADVFALGIVLWEMLTGRRLFAAGSERKTMAAIARAEVVPPSRFAGGIPPELDAVVLGALTRDPTRRPPSAVLVQQLEELVAVLPSRHDDLTALLERVWGSPHDTGPVRTLASLGPPSRPGLGGSRGRGDAGAEPSTRLGGDTTLEALAGRETWRRPARPRPGRSGTRTWLLTGAVGAVAVLLGFALLGGERRVPETVRSTPISPPTVAPLPPTPTAATPAPTPEPTKGAGAITPALAADAGASAAPGEMPAPAAPEATSRPARPVHRSHVHAPSRHLPAPAVTPPLPLKDHRPNPFQ